MVTGEMMHQVCNTVMIPVEEYEALRRELQHSQNKLKESGRTKLREQLAAMTAERNGAKTLAIMHCEQLIASQAREQQLREEMLRIAGYCRIWGGEAERARKLLEHYLNRPADDTALKQYGAKLLRDAAEWYGSEHPVGVQLNRMAGELEGLK